MAYTDEELEIIWGKAKRMNEKNEKMGFRKDTCDAWVQKKQYGKRDSTYGWEVDHIDPDGPDEIDNYQPLQWENNVAKSDGNLDCVVTSEGDKNVETEKS